VPLEEKHELAKAGEEENSSSDKEMDEEGEISEE